MMIPRFEQWLIDQRYRKDLIGDLARYPSMQNIEQNLSKRKSDEHKDWANIVIRIALNQGPLPFSTRLGKNSCWQSKQQKSPWINLGLLRTNGRSEICAPLTFSPLLISPDWGRRKPPDRPMAPGHAHVSIGSERA
jgi:hypothetical protein